MIEDLPGYIGFLFAITAGTTVAWFYFSTKKSMFFLLLAGAWIILQTVLAVSGVYLDLEAMPPRLMIANMPALILIAVLFLTNSGRKFIDSLDLRKLTYLSTLRIPVEITLVLLFHYGVLSQLQTFEGANFDILAGITAPVVGFLAFRNGRRNTTMLWVWNILSLLLLLNIVVISILAFPFPMQQLAFDQSGIAMLYFPFNLLPTVVVPIVLLCHLAAFRQLMKSPKAPPVA